MTTEQQSNGAERLCETLIVQGVDVCFANPGTSEMHFVAALDRRPDMRCVLGLSEGVVTGAADGYGRMADKPAATLLHLGPGLANGLANLHNAKRARTPVINVVGDHATYHLKFDAPLASDIDGLARPMSDWVGRATHPDKLPSEAADAWEAAVSTPGVATLILPADIAWNKAQGGSIKPRQRAALPPVEMAKIKAAAADLRQPGRTVLLLGGRALRAGTLQRIAAICAKTGAEFMAETFNARIERGQGRVPVRKLPYYVDPALARLRGVERIILVDARPPVAFFAYPDKPSLMNEEGSRITTLVGHHEDLADAIERLADEVGAAETAPLPGGGVKEPPAFDPGPLTADTACAIVAASLPDGAIVTDESVSSGRMFFEASYNAPAHDYMQLTGGSIGIGLPLATGAAVACPDRRVVCLQADGSAMYTVQALWTQARERLDVTTVILSNRRYAILENEMANVGVQDYGANARRMLTFDDPALDWISLARGHGVEGARAQTGAELADLLRSSFRRRGPFLVEAVI